MTNLQLLLPLSALWCA